MCVCVCVQTDRPRRTDTDTDTDTTRHEQKLKSKQPTLTHVIIVSRLQLGGETRQANTNRQTGTNPNRQTLLACGLRRTTGTDKPWCARAVDDDQENLFFGDNLYGMYLINTGLQFAVSAAALRIDRPGEHRRPTHHGACVGRAMGRCRWWYAAAPSHMNGIIKNREREREREREQQQPGLGVVGGVAPLFASLPRNKTPPKQNHPDTLRDSPDPRKRERESVCVWVCV